MNVRKLVNAGIFLAVLNFLISMISMGMSYMPMFLNGQANLTMILNFFMYLTAVALGDGAIIIALLCASNLAEKYDQIRPIPGE